MNTQELSESEFAFPGTGGALYRRSVEPANPMAVLGVIHGYGDHSGRYAKFMRWMAERGVACHAVDLRGQGRSEGRRGFVRQWGDYLEDVNAFLALDEMKSSLPTFLLGHSHGGLVLAAAVERGVQGIAGCILTSPFFKAKLAVPRYKILMAHLFNHVVPWLPVHSGLADNMMTSDAAMRAETKADALVSRAATPRWYLGSLEAQQRVLAEAPKFQLPLAVLLGEIDPVADITTAKHFFDAVGSSEKKLKVYPGFLHEILRETQREEVFQEILDWIHGRIRS